MSEKPDFRDYINPGPKGSKFGAAWQEPPDDKGERYIEDKSGKKIDALIQSVRKGSIVRVRRLFCLGVWPRKGLTPRKRRQIVGDRMEAILGPKHNGVILEWETGLRTDKRGDCIKMLNGAYEDIASAGRSVAKGRTGRPPKYDFTAAEWEVIEGIWTGRKFANDGARLAAIEKRLGRVPGRTLIRNKLGSPHKGRE